MNPLSATYIADAAGVGGDARALECLRRHGLPDTKWEEWRYTSLNGKLSERLELPGADSGELPSLPAGIAEDLIFTNGRLQAGDLPSGISLGGEGLNFSLSERDSFEALNLVLNPKPAVLRVSSDLARPLFVVHFSSPAGSTRPTLTPRLEVLVEKNVRAVICEVFISPEGAAHQSFPVTHSHLEEGAFLEHIKLIVENPAAVHIGKFRARLKRDAQLRNFTFALSGGSSRGSLVRNNVDVELEGTGASAGVHGLFALGSGGHHDHFCVVRHKREHTHSDQLFKTVLGEESRGVFTGKVVVDKNCPHVDSIQLNKNLLLSPKAHADTRPQLEIFTDDVKCSHGATVGQLSEEEMFYLQSRGLPAARVRQILCHAFSAEVIEKIPEPQMRELVGRLLYENFERVALGEGGAS